LLESRLARSLLMMRDRVRSNALHLTHEFLSHALGVRRVGITKAATALQQRGLISYSRGDIRILDDAGLEVAACSCYQVVKGLAGRR
jgi:CRP-like cAMP-binding protein